MDGKAKNSVNKRLGITGKYEGMNCPLEEVTKHKVLGWLGHLQKAGKR